MLALYLIALTVGGIMLGLAAFGGAAHQGHGVDAPDGDAGHGALDAALAWLPVTSLRFWLSFAAFGGLTGTAMTLGGFVGPEPAPAIAALAVGWLAGVLVVGALRRLTRDDVSSAVGAGDLVGASATVIVAIARGAPGKVRVRMKDRAIDLVAATEDAGVLGEGREVVIYELAAAGGVVVTGGEPDGGRT
jgi:hypothetical protein